MKGYLLTGFFWFCFTLEELQFFFFFFKIKAKKYLKKCLAEIERQNFTSGCIISKEILLLRCRIFCDTGFNE